MTGKTGGHLNVQRSFVGPLGPSLPSSLFCG